MMFKAHCTCGWSLERERDAANLLEENNRSIVDSAVDAHEFAHEFKEDGHETTRNWERQ
jgi:hypothetical protein